MKKLIKEKFPFLIRIAGACFHFYLKNHYRLLSSEKVFTEIYKKNRWKGISQSGIGSSLEETEIIRKKLPKLFLELKVKSLLDIPCGDFYWFKEIELGSISYIGADIVEDIIIKNKKYENKNRTFIKLDLCYDSIPKVDLIFCRDLFQHLPTKDISKAITNIKKSYSKYLITSSHLSTKLNKEIIKGEYRELNLLLPPFSFPKPLKIIDEKFVREGFPMKSLLLWNVEDLPENLENAKLNRRN